MERIELKLELLRSNPLMIRQFAVPTGYTTPQLYQIIRILLGWEEKEAYRFWKGKEAFVSKNTVADLFTGQSSVYFQVGTGEEKWLFRLAATGNPAQDGEMPSVSRFRGNNPPRDCNGVRKFNELQNYWESDSWNYYDSFLRNHPEKDSYFSMTMVKRELRRTFGTEEEQRRLQQMPEMDYKSALDSRVVLEGSTVADMKNMAERLGLRVPAGLRKSALVDFLTRQLSDWTTLDSLLQQMTLGQYRMFQQICGGTEDWGNAAARETASLLADCGFVGYSAYDPLEEDGQKIFFTRELLAAYEDWLEQDREEALLHSALLRTTLRGSLMLYGCVSRKKWKELARRWMKDTCQDEELDRIWDSASDWLNPMDYNCVEPELIYDTNEMKKEEAETLLQMAEKMGRYVPPLTELKKIEAEGLRFPAREEKVLRNFLKQNFWLTESKTEWYLLQFYQGLHCRAALSAISSWLSMQEGTRRRKVLRDLEGILASVGGVVRRTDLFGYTEQEWAKLRRN